jgi:hypothetical protein
MADRTIARIVTAHFIRGPRAPAGDTLPMFLQPVTSRGAPYFVTTRGGAFFT